MRAVRKRFGQHFLRPEWIAAVVRAIAPSPTDVFLEIGPGQGALTRPLAARASRVVAVEIDRDLAEDLRRTAPPNVSVVTGDVLEFDIASLAREAAPADGLRVAGNLPYNVSSPVLFRLIDAHRQTGLLRDATVMLQREVVDRLAAQPGTREYGVLTVMLRLHAEVEPVLTLSPGAFRPPPKVHSALARFRFTPPRVALRDPARFEQVVKALFSQRRKTVVNAVKPLCPDPGAAAAAVAAAGLDPRRRPETLDLAELAVLAGLLSSGNP
ncbi:MAG TPA: 16S rRNA (adenine(1518)-N(6)/adenine(1519)-N(6))-dimethyltransferase RsmA [Vicinamibacterales bacterium]|nr:16S rRNA (adenine(1518)-N(6)/adenine(1519)-N(6))-dimethyltransferase RsmA [Vicinamibacterales bacterium]